MRTLFAVLMMAAALTAKSQGTSGPIDAVYPVDIGSTAGFFSGTAGWTFQPTVAMTVTQLGFFNQVLAAQNGPMTVGLWAHDGTLLATTNISTSNVLTNESNYQDIPSVSLEPLLIYHIGAYSGSDYSLNVIIPGTSGSYTPGFGIDSNSITWAVSTNGFGLPTAQAGNHNMAAGATFRYVVPEPATIALLALSGFAVLCWSRKPRS